MDLINVLKDLQSFENIIIKVRYKTRKESFIKRRWSIKACDIKKEEKNLEKQHQQIEKNVYLWSCMNLLYMRILKQPHLCSFFSMISEVYAYT